MLAAISFFPCHDDRGTPSPRRRVNHPFYSPPSPQPLVSMLAPYPLLPQEFNIELLFGEGSVEC